MSDHVIEKTVRLAAGNLHYMLKHFYPALDRSDSCDINELNLSFQFSHALLSWRPDASAYFEVPFECDAARCSTISHGTQRYDFFLHDGTVGIVGETKMLWCNHSQFDRVLEDKEKMCRNNVEKMLAVCSKDRPSYSKVFRLLLIGTWVKEIAEWWLGRDVKISAPYSRGELLSGMFADVIHVARYPEASMLREPKDKGTLYLMYAYETILPYKSETPI